MKLEQVYITRICLCHAAIVHCCCCRCCPLGMLQRLYDTVLLHMYCHCDACEKLCSMKAVPWR
jgi:hypothetical protein